MDLLVTQKSKQKSKKDPDYLGCATALIGVPKNLSNLADDKLKKQHLRI
jgi:hypothetical protein